MAERFEAPLFAPMHMHIEDNPDGSYDYLMCLWSTGKESKEFCGETCGDFYKFLSHLRHVHGLNLSNRTDYCFDCEMIFSSRLDSIQHHLAKALSPQDFEMACEKGSDAAAMKTWLAPVYENINALRKIIMNKILFSEHMPNTQFEMDDVDAVDKVDGPGSHNQDQKS